MSSQLAAGQSMSDSLQALSRSSRDDILTQIVARTRTDMLERVRQTPLRTLQRLDVPPSRDFVGALTGPALSLIAEFKPASPSRGPLRDASEAPTFASLYDWHASAVSVLCDGPFFGGGYHLLAQFRRLCQRPLLCKDFILDEYQIWEARAHGADAVLLMASIHTGTELGALLGIVHDVGMQALVEVHTEAEVETALACNAPIIGINSRDLATLSVNTDRLAQLRQRIPPGRVVVAESGMRSRAQVDALRGVFDAVLIGTAFMTATEPTACMAELGW